MKISIIIPVYNISDYISNSICSVLNQTFVDFELLLIDDGSSDGSGDICDSYLSKDYRIKVFHQTNEGVTSARRKGVEMSKGEYILFIDGDDEIPKDSLNLLYRFALEKELDIVIGGYNSVFENKVISNICLSKCVFSKHTHIELLLQMKLHTAPWARLFKKKMFDENSLNISSYFVNGEDTIMNIRLAKNAEKIGYLPIPIYNYNERPASFSKTFRNSYQYLIDYELEVVNSLGDLKNDSCLFEPIIRFRLRVLKDMILVTTDFRRDSAWLKDLLSNVKKIDCTMSELMFVYISKNIYLVSIINHLYNWIKKIRNKYIN